MAEKKTKTRPVKEEKVQKPAKEKPQKKPNAKGFLLNKVPFTNCYEECGIVEARLGEFSVAYKVDINGKHTNKTVEDLKNGLRKIFINPLFQGMSFQFFIQNSIIEIGDYLDNVHLRTDKGEALNKCIRAYNAMIDNNAEVGHNNFERSIIVVFSTQAEMVDDAITKFQEMDDEIVNLFKSTYGYNIHRQTLEERLETIYSLFHPDKSSTYAAKRPDVASIKAALCPDNYEWKHTAHLKIGNMYAKTLFINSVPSIVSNTLLNDLMSTASNSVLSISCVPMDTQLGYKVAKKKVEDNTEEKRVLIRNTVEDRKHKRSELKVDRKRENETEYFYEQAEKALEKTVENNDVMMMTTFLITLFADSKEDLERNTSLLELSASKFAVQIRVCEDLQDDAFQSIFPVCNNKVHMARFISSADIATLQPLSAKSVFSNSYSFCGLNSISDNFVLINRDLCRTGIISGISHCGKSFTVKREALNKLMNSNEDVLIITRQKKPYEIFAEKVEGKMFQSEHVDFYQLSQDERMKALIFETFMINDAGLHTKRLSSLRKKTNMENMKREAGLLSHFNTWNEAVRGINVDKQSFSSFMSALRKGHEEKKDYMTGFKKEASFINDAHRLKIVNIENDAELVISMASALKYIKRAEEQGRKVNIFVDSVDGLFFSTVGSDYITAFMDEVRESNSSATVVIQDAVRIFTNQDAKIEYELFLDNIDYYKLLAQGPIERQAYVDKLNIPTSLVPYLTDREPGEGVIITPAENVAFNDRFENQTDAFYKLFYM